MRFAAPAGPTTQPAPSRFANLGGTSTSHPPTPEQEQIIDAYRSGQTVVVEALAGTGKTTTLRMIAATDTRRPGVYVAYNKAIVNEAQGRFPASVLVSTAHSLAYQAVGKRYANRLPGRGRGSQRMTGLQVSKLLGVQPASTGQATLSPVMITRLAQATVDNWCKTGDYTIEAHHLPRRAEHLGPLAEVGEIVVPIARKIWDDLCKVNGRLYFTHDHYLKMWQLSDPKLPYDYVMFDEAQDANPVIAAVVERQAHCQLIYVGDRNQQLYAWRGAVDAMQALDGIRLALTKSFRFGPAIANEANRWLDLLGSPHRLAGHEPVVSEIGPVELPDAILCRTNGTALGHVLVAQERGVPVAMAPGDANAGKDIRAFAYGARDLMAGKGSDHPDLAAFKTWAELLTYVDEEEDGADLQRLVNIVNRIGPGAVIGAINRLVPKEKAQLTVSTAHKAKGLEWDRVRVADDFVPPADRQPPPADPQVDPADLMLAYVTVTRAKRQLDPGPLDPTLWV